MPRPAVDRERLKALFEQLDINKDGRIDVNEIQKGLSKLGINKPGEAERVVSLGDTDNDGLMDFSEFVNYCTEHEEKLWAVFDYLDINKDGMIDAQEIKSYLHKIGIQASDAAVNQLLEKMDQDGNVKISWEEWRDFLILQPNTNLRFIFNIWSHSTFSNIGESMDSVLIPDEFTEEEKVMGMWWRQLVSGGGAGAVSRTCTAPLDRLKLFFQVQSMQGQRFTLVSCFRHMLNEGGVWSLWRGNGVNVVKIAPESALRFFAFEKTKALLKRDNHPLKVYERLLAGSTAGVIAQTTIYPMEVLKTRLALGKTGQYKGITDCFRQILRNEGLFGLYRGLTPSLVGIIPYAGIDLTIYETLKNVWLLHHDDSNSEVGVLVPLACGTVSSTFGQLSSYPLALVRTRLQAQTSPLTGQEKALGMIGTFRLIAKEEGLRGLYRGIIPNFLKVIPAVSIGYVVYEQLKTLLGVTSIK